MKKLSVVILALVLCVFMCVSCKPEREAEDRLVGEWYQSYPDEDGVAMYKHFSFSGARFTAYSKDGKTIDKGDFYLEDGRIYITFDDNKSMYFTYKFKDKEHTLMVLNGKYRYHRIGY